MTVLRRLAVVMIALAASAPSALAHHPMGGTTPSTFAHGLLSGIGHPVIGVDHLAFLVGIGLLAGLSGSGLGVPLAFVAASLAGVLAGAKGVSLSFAEHLVAGTVMLAGFALVIRLAAPAAAWTAFATAAGLVHGLVYAETVIGAEPTPIVGYLAGLALVQALIGWAAVEMGVRTGVMPRAALEVRAGGVVLALIGGTYFVAALAGS